MDSASASSLTLIVVAVVAPLGAESLKRFRIPGVVVGFFVPVFFVVSGMKFDVDALFASPSTLLRVSNL